MSRIPKEGFEYFPLDTIFDSKMDLIEAKFGITGCAVVVKLWQKAYREHGYYCVWDSDVALLFSRVSGLGCNLVSEIVSAAIRRGIFDKNMFNKYQILTSRGIQKRCQFIISTSKLKRLGIDPKYNLLSDSMTFFEISEENEKTSEESTQIKVNKIKVNKKKIDAFFESVWELYPKKKGKGFVSDTKKANLYKIGYDRIALCVTRYLLEREGKDEEFTLNGSTFFNRGYIDYLDENYSKHKQSEKRWDPF
jgi:hypothetical protein